MEKWFSFTNKIQFILCSFLVYLIIENKSLSQI